MFPRYLDLKKYTQDLSREHAVRASLNFLDRSCGNMLLSLEVSCYSFAPPAKHSNSGRNGQSFSGMVTLESFANFVNAKKTFKFSSMKSTIFVALTKSLIVRARYWTLETIHQSNSKTMYFKKFAS